MPCRGNCDNPPNQQIPVIVEGILAQHGEVDYATADGNDYAEHESTYRFFIKLVKWNVYVLAAMLVLMAIFLT